MLLHVLQDFPDLLQCEEQDDGEGALAGEGGEEAFVEGQAAFLPDRLHGTVEGASVRPVAPWLHFHGHDAGAHDIDRVGGRRRHHARQEARGHVHSRAFPEHPAPQQALLDVVVRRQLARRHHHRPLHRQRGARP